MLPVLLVVLPWAIALLPSSLLVRARRERDEGRKTRGQGARPVSVCILAYPTISAICWSKVVKKNLPMASFQFRVNSPTSPATPYEHSGECRSMLPSQHFFGLCIAQLLLKFGDNCNVSAWPTTKLVKAPPSFFVRASASQREAALLPSSLWRFRSFAEPSVCVLLSCC